MFKWIRICGLLLASMILTLAVPVNGQRLCEAIVEKALEQAGENCAGLEGDQACYGYDNLTPTFFEEVEAGVLTTAGSTIELPPIQIIDSNGFDAEEDEWGIGYLQLSDGGAGFLEEGEFVRIILMGDVTVENNIQPDDDELFAFEEMFMSAGDGSDCQEAVNDMVIQAPQGTEIELLINDVEVALGSTVVFGWGDDDDGEFMYMTVLDGRGYPNAYSDNEIEIGLRQISTVRFSEDEEPMLDSEGYAMLDEDGNPMMRRYVDTEWSDPVELSDDADGVWGIGYYETFERIPESLLNYPIDLEAEDEPCDCELDEDETQADNSQEDVAECSIETGGVITVTFANNGDTPFDVYWSNFECLPEFYGTLAPGESYEQDTVIGHEWGFVQDGEVISYFVVDGAGTYSFP